MFKNIYPFFLVTTVINCRECIINCSVGLNESSLHLPEKMLSGFRINSVHLDNVMESETYRRMERLARCVEKVNRASFERTVGVFYQRSSTSQEILVTKYLQRVSHDLNVLLHGNWNEDFSDNTLIHNFVIFLHDLENFNDVDKVLSRQMVDRKGKFVICISSILWTEELLVLLANSLWNSKVANVVMVVSDNRGQIRIYAYTPVEPGKCVPSKVYVLVDDCDERDVDAKNLFERKMRNMNQCKVVASSVSMGRSATVYMENGTRKVGGFEGTIFNTIADKMNFTRVITPVPRSLWGDELPNGTWNGVHGNIMRGVADVGFCLMFPAATRLHFEEYSYAFATDRYIWILPEPLPTNWNKVLRPFELTVWLAALAAMVAGQTVMCLIARNSKEKRAIALNLWGITLGQSMMKTDDRGLASFFLLWWTIYSFVLTTAYQSGLVGFLTSVGTIHRLSTVEELLQSGIPFGGAKTPAQFYNHPENPEDYKVYENYQVIPLSKYMILFYNLVYGKVRFATLVMESGVEEFKISGSWYALKETTLYYPRPFVFPKGSPYITEFNIQISRLVEGGLVNFWFRSNTTGTFSSPGASHIPLRVIHVTSIFAVWLIGLSISGLIFVGEILYYGRSTNKKREKSAMKIEIGSHCRNPHQPTPGRISKSENSIESIAVALSRRQRNPVKLQEESVSRGSTKPRDKNGLPKRICYIPRGLSLN